MFLAQHVTRPTRRRTGRLLGALLAVVVAGMAGLVGAAPASAAAGSYVRLAHLSPDTPEVDVYLTPFGKSAAVVVLRGVGYGALSPYQQLPAGRYSVAMRAAGAAPSSPPVISVTVNATAGSAHTVAGVGRFSSLGLKVLDDDLALPPAGQARVRVIQASARVPSLNVSTENGPVASNVAFATTTDYQTVPAGSWTLSLEGTENGANSTAKVALAAGAVYSVVVLDAPDGGLKTVVRTDARGAKVVPDAGVNAGFGGAAESPWSGWIVAGAGAGGVLLAVVVGLLVAARRAGGGGRHAASV